MAAFPAAVPLFFFFFFLCQYGVGRRGSNALGFVERSVSSSAKVTVTCLLSCSAERLSVESRHLELKEQPMKDLCGKGEGTQYVLTSKRAVF